MIKTIRRAFQKHPLTGALWALNLAVIPTVSYFGRPLQRFLADTIGRDAIAAALAGIVGLLLLVGGWALFRKAGWRGLLHLLWMITLTVLVMIYVRRNPERWYHIPLFSGFGFLSVRLFSLRTGAEIAFAFAVLDEIFQHFLSERVGDIEDIIINTLCAAAGIILCLLIGGQTAPGAVRKGCRPEPD